MQLEIPLYVCLNGPTRVDEAIIRSFDSTSAAIIWSFENRDNKVARSTTWIAHCLGIKRQRLSRIVNHGDFKLDAGQVPLWDCLVGNTAVSQYVELQRQLLIQAKAERAMEEIKRGMAA